jgi:periplasmic protein TonB
MGSMDDVAVLSESTDHDLFLNLNAPRTKGRSRRGFYASIVVHAGLFVAALAVALYSHVPMPELQTDPIRAIIYNPGAPHPPPKLLGTVDIPVVGEPKTRPEAVNPTTSNSLTLPDAVVNNTVAPLTTSTDVGSLDGSPGGHPDGQEGGVPGGVPGGTGTDINGCIGCTGNGPVTDYEKAPSLIRQTRPQYPQEAFVKKIEGTVTVEIWIDATGKVVYTRVIKSIPQLDLAATQTVRQWLFMPATKNGRPVASLAHAPVTFRIY